jgi:hypothetical protein
MWEHRTFESKIFGCGKVKRLPVSNIIYADLSMSKIYIAVQRLIIIIVTIIQ